VQDLYGLRPMEPVLVESPSENPDFLFQVKWDGVRLLLQKRGDTVRLWNRKGRDKTETYPELVDWAREQPADQFVLDGEVISLGASGLPDFRRVLRRDLARRPRLDIGIGYVVFDCLQQAGHTLLERPLEARQEALAAIVGNGGLVQACDNFDDGRQLFQRMQELGMEGVVGKRRGSLYYVGEKRPIWQKTKCWRHVQLDGLFVKWREGRPAAVIVGDWEREQDNAGAVATGIAASDWRVLGELSAQSPPAPGHPDWRALPRGVKLVVRFLEWTENGQLRHPVVERIELGPSP
jgi:bifunctional non-homologous end joining protein LigD